MTPHGKRAFSVIGPQLWNSLPPDTRNSSSLPIFRSRLRTHLQNCVPSLGSFPSPSTVYPDFDSCYSHFMPYQMTPSVRHRAIEIHYYYYYYYYYRIMDYVRIMLRCYDRIMLRWGISLINNALLILGLHELIVIFVVHVLLLCMWWLELINERFHYYLQCKVKVKTDYLYSGTVKLDRNRWVSLILLRFTRPQCLAATHLSSPEIGSRLSWPKQQCTCNAIITNQAQHSTNEGVLRSNSACSMLMSDNLQLPWQGIESRLSRLWDIGSTARPSPLPV